MSSITTITELRTMQLADLRREVRAQQTEVRKLRLQIEMNTEKDSAKYRREKRQLARMMMVMGEKEKGIESPKATEGTKAKELKQKPKTARVAAPKKPKTSKKSS